MCKQRFSGFTMNFSIAAPAIRVTALSGMLLGCLSVDALAAEPVLTARPGVCILENPGKTPCVMALELAWNNNGTGDFCLHSSQSSEPLQCWISANQGRRHAELTSRENVSFWLQKIPDDRHLAEITIRIVSLSQRNPQRRRRRHVWNVL
ncbi:MAG: hypothetical protein ACI9GB_000888 [Halioglobus sp.]|jgi:hypothetical protein